MRHYPTCLALLCAPVTVALASDVHNDNDIDTITAMFAGTNMVGEPVLVDCTRSSGTQTECIAVTFP